MTACRYTVSGSVSLPSPGFFSPFPHGTSALSVVRKYLALEDGPPGFPRDFSCPAVLRNLPSEPVCFRLRAYHPLWIGFPAASTTAPVCNFPADPQIRPNRTHNPRPTTLAGLAQAGFGLFPFRSPLLRESRLLSVPGGTEMFQFPPFASPTYGFS